MFAEADPLTKVTLELVSHSLGSAEVQQFREEFQIIDRSHLGRLDRRDFCKAFEACDVSLLLVVVGAGGGV